MGLISTEIELTLNGSNMKHYEDLGYIIPKRKDKQGKYKTKRGTKIKVKVSDLSHGCNHNVKVQCDKCGKIKDVKYYNFYRNNRNGLYYCHSCATKMNSGEKHYHWDNTKTNEERINGRNYPEYVNFVKQVLARDNYTCQCCGQEHGELNVHHLNGYSWFKEGRTDLKNGITLCENCHMNFHYKYGKEKNTKEQFEEWIGKILTLNSLDLHNLPIARKIYCIEEDKVYDSALVLEKEWNTFHTLIYGVCNKKYYTVCNKHLLWFDEYLKMTKDDIEKYLEICTPKHYKKVVCITTSKIFKTSKEGSLYYNCSNHIIACCKGQRNYCGALPDGTKLQWMYYEDYIKHNNLVQTKEQSENNVV